MPERTESDLENSIFVWRYTIPSKLDLGPEGVGPSDCPCCSTHLKREARDEWDDEYVNTPVHLCCLLCGWDIRYVVEGVYNDPWHPRISYSTDSLTVLKQFDINSSEIALHELGSFLKRH